MCGGGVCEGCGGVYVRGVWGVYEGCGGSVCEGCMWGVGGCQCDERRGVGDDSVCVCVCASECVG